MTQPGQPAIPKLPTGVLYALTVACAVATASLAYATLSRPLNSWRKDIERRAELVQAKLQKGPELRRLHAEQQQEIDSLLARVEQVSRRLPDEPREGEFLSDLTRLAGEHGVTIHDFRRGTTRSNDTHSVVEVSITAEGSYRGLVGLVDGVAKLPRLAELSKLQIDGRNETQDVYPAMMTYALYYGMVTPANGEGQVP